MTCYISNDLRVEQRFYTPLCSVEADAVYNDFSGRVAVIVPGKMAMVRDMVEDVLYEYPDEALPFTVKVLNFALFGDTGFTKFEVCDLIIEEPPEEPPDDFFAILTWIKDKVLETFTIISGWKVVIPALDTLLNKVNLDVGKVITDIEGVKKYVNTLITDLKSSIEGYIYNTFDDLKLTLILKTDEISTKIDNIQTPDPGIIITPIIEGIRAELETLADKIIERVWSYIEDQLFEEES